MPTAAIDEGTAMAMMAQVPVAVRSARNVSRAPERPAAHRGRGAARAWWQAWRARFGLAEVCGTTAAAIGFAAGYLPAGSLLSAAGLATICEVLGFYGCIGAKTVAAACRATAHLGGRRRLAAGAWHVMREQLASCAVAEAVDGFLIRPACLAGPRGCCGHCPPGCGSGSWPERPSRTWPGTGWRPRPGEALPGRPGPAGQDYDLTDRTACPGLRASHHGWLLLVKCVNVSMSSAL